MGIRDTSDITLHIPSCSAHIRRHPSELIQWSSGPNGRVVVEEDKHKQQVHLPFGKLSLIIFMVLSAENYGNIHSFTTSCVVFLRLLTRTLLLAQRKSKN
jgi:hypothetical protein